MGAVWVDEGRVDGPNLPRQDPGEMATKAPPFPMLTSW